MTYQQHLDTLYDMLENTENFEAVVNYFLDHLGEKPSFRKLGEALNDHPAITSFVQNILTKDASKKAPITLLLLKYTCKNFIHGSAYVDNEPVFIIYFEDHSLGLMVTACKETGKTHIIRFGAKIVTDTGEEL